MEVRREWKRVRKRVILKERAGERAKYVNYNRRAISKDTILIL